MTGIAGCCARAASGHAAVLPSGYAPAWALGDAGELAAFPVLIGVESITILVDHDLSGTGQQAALRCSARWTSAGREVFRLVPSQPGPT
jgi:putative DNA primase/helicase